MKENVNEWKDIFMFLDWETEQRCDVNTPQNNTDQCALY